MPLALLGLAAVCALVCRSLSERRRASAAVFRNISIACMVSAATIFLFTQRLW